jgi:hypothetical protein
MYARKLFTVLALTALVVPAVDADGKRKRKPKVQAQITGCKQKHRGDVDDIILRAQARVVKPRASTSTYQKITWTFTMTGPYVSDGTGTADSNAKGVAKVGLGITGPGEYLVEWTASSAGAKPAAGKEKITITGPVTAPCAHEPVA